MAPKGTFVSGSCLTSPSKLTRLNVSEDMNLPQNVQEHKKFLFFHCQSVSNFSKKWKRVISYSKTFIFFVKVFKKCPNSRVCFRFFTGTTFYTFILLEHIMDPKTMSRVCSTKGMKLSFFADGRRRMNGWRTRQFTGSRHKSPFGAIIYVPHEMTCFLFSMFSLF